MSPLLHASNPIRFGAGAHHGAAAQNEPATEAGLLAANLDHIRACVERLTELWEHQREQRLTLHTEFGYIASGARLELGPQTQDQFRITYIWAYAGAAATLHLKGGQTVDSLAFPIPVPTQPPLQIVIGDDRTGGLILDWRDQRFITTNDGSSQLIVAVLAGEVLKDSYRS